jgi:UPF0755 protein
VQPEEQITPGQPGGGPDPGDLAGKPAGRKPLTWTLIGLAASLAVALGLAAVYILAPAELSGRQVTLLIRPGQTLPAAARELEDAGLVRNARAFALLGRLFAGQGPRAGEFRLATDWPPLTILRVITTTNGIQHRVGVREGLPWWEAAKLFDAEGLCDGPSFERAMHNATLLAKYGVPGDSAEGFLFPETYMLSRSFADGGSEAVEAMIREFARQANKLWPQGPPPPDELRRIVILASVVERETGDPSERPRIAGVFLNRLKKNMRLQSDPTTIYGLGPAFDGKLGRAHLEDPDNAYNTYAHNGLPPGPICSPGLASLRAVLQPETNDYLYFVAKGDGSHEFSRTLEEHNSAVNKYQRHRVADYRSAPAPAGAAAAVPPSPTTPAVPAKPAGPAPVKTAEPAKTAATAKPEAKPAAKPKTKAAAKKTAHKAKKAEPKAKHPAKRKAEAKP